ncbi:tyrosine-protein phosphatase 10D isoform X1 [Drosophila innubila]|uniref:tyrosine-protein phosphatase 10D isoform X1 n=1 Tax=Drosophila innubila TaxID=198719 RepID=UPI00148C7BEA|nr:tyrosine-protein phosphatase 10D isoform X1 [Drosophila innubila]XP_034475510.1 tyrosine-protein phosphatase 10D isoform X1 [Drosophila innubila]
MDNAMERQQQQQQQPQKHNKRKKQQKEKQFLLVFIILTICWPQVANGADLVISVPNASSNDNAFYRIDYSPPFGYPEPNTTIPASEIGQDIKLSRVLPGSEYNFWLYYTNSTHRELLTWTVNITTAPDPPENLSVQLRSSKSAFITWKPPGTGQYSGFKIKVLGLTEPPHTEYNRSSVLAGNETLQLSVKELTPGGTYQVQAYTLYQGKESVAYTSRNFTTKPNTPGKFIVWFRNETTLLVLWQPPYPAGLYTHYKVSITPNDAIESVQNVQREGEPPGPAQAAFKGLVPGRPYNISVQTVSENETSVPTTARYLTVPERPINVTFDPHYTTTSSFRVRWEAPRTYSEYDSFQVSLQSPRRVFTVPRTDANSRHFDFPDTLEPGKTYEVVVKTISESVNSWPVNGQITLRPNPVRNLRAYLADRTNTLFLYWEPAEKGTQDSYRISYYEKSNETDAETSTPQVVETKQTEFKLDPVEPLLPGRRYQIEVQALSNGISSNASSLIRNTRPAAPIIQELRSIPQGLNISWRSDVNSRQDHYDVHYQRNGTNEERTISTNHTSLIIKYLHPGSGYEIKVYAISHDMRSEPHSYFQAVFPKPPRNLTQQTVNTNLVLLHWQPPEGSDYSEYAVRYRTAASPWQRLLNVHEPQARIEDMHYGERYLVQVNTVSFGVESPSPLELNITMPPQPVSNVVPLVDSRNLTLEWPRPDGHVDYYTIKWWATDDSQQLKYKNVSQLPEELSSSSVRIPIEELSPGRQYKFEVQASSNGIRSGITHLSTRTMPLIQSDVFISNAQDDMDEAAENEQEQSDTEKESDADSKSRHPQSNSITLNYTPTPASSTRFDIYRFSLGDPLIKDKEKLANDTERKLSFTGLTPGRLYNITVWTVSGGVASLPIQRLYRLHPLPISDLQATQLDAREITLKWTAPVGEFTDFELQYLNADENSPQLLQNVTGQTQLTLQRLQPYHNYTFTVSTRSGSDAGSAMMRTSAPISASYQTLPAAPGRVDFFQPTDVQPGEITFEWLLSPQEQHGTIEHFRISCENIDDAADLVSYELSANATQARIHNLVPGNTYVFRIQAKSSLGYGYGAEREHRQQMPILAPPVPLAHIMPIEVSRSSSTIQIRFRQSYFSNAHGLVRWYTIIVAEDVGKNASGLEMPSWQDVQSYTVWLPYQAIEPYNPFTNTSNLNGAIEDFTIGSDACDKHRTGYCNGPLKSATTYRIKVRAFTEENKFTDTAYSEPITTDRDDVLWLGILLASGLFVVCVGLVLGYYRYRCNSMNRPSNKLTRMQDELTALPEGYIEPNRPVHVKDFAEHYRLMSADSDFRFSEEFEDLKNVGRDQACSFADLPCNRPKNRFTNILPYDHSRFKLQPVDDDDGSDYINANYMPGHNSPREFIVTQGPLHSTREEFWRMCWESNSRAIVMLTRCFEKGREKCDQYWPIDPVPIFYGDIKVQLMTNSHFLDWSIAEFMVSRNCESRIMRHFHFTTWPDFGVPEPPQSLVRFVRAFRDRIGTDMRPIIVHCSAGVGRSGTFIALDRILQHINKSDYVDIFGIVFAMRKERVFMVQTEQQYVCIHQCLLAVLEGKEYLLAESHELHENDGYEVTKIYLERSKATPTLQATPMRASLALAEELDRELELQLELEEAENEDQDDLDDDDDDQQPLNNETTATLSSDSSSNSCSQEQLTQQQQQPVQQQQQQQAANICTSTETDTDTEDEDGDGIDKSPLLDDEGIAETGI